MVLPTDEHAALTGWLNARRKGCADEYGGTVCIGEFGPLRHLIRREHLSAEVKAIFRFARSAPGVHDRVPQEVHEARELLLVPVVQALEAICADLAEHGVVAHPCFGMGALVGGEVFSCTIVIDTPDRLAEVLGVHSPGRPCGGAPDPALASR